MNIRKIYLSLILCSLSLGCYAVEVASQPGMLQSLMKDAGEVSTLKITGTIDARDFKYLYDSQPNILNLDLSEVEIAAYDSREVLFGTANKYEADIFPEYCFFDSRLSNIILPKSLEAIAPGTFSGSKMLENIEFPSAVKRIGDYSFYDCDKLTGVTIPETVETIGDYAFAQCDALSKIDVRSNYDRFAIPDNCFKNCVLLSDVQLPTNTIKIGVDAFVGCNALNKVNFPTGIEIISEAAFCGVPLEQVDLSQCKKLTDIGDYSFAQNPLLQEIKLVENIKHIGVGAFFYNRNMNLQEFAPEIDTVSDYLFAGCKSMDMGELPINIVSIGKYAFADWTQMIKFTLQSGVETIGDNAFENCKGLQELRVETPKVPELGANVFAGIDQKNSKLYVQKHLIDEYRSASQWKEFDVQIGTSVSKTEVVNELKVYFDATILKIESSNEIKEVLVYDVAGLELIHRNVGSTNVDIETSDYTSKFYIVAIKLTNGDVQSIKLIRK